MGKKERNSGDYIIGYKVYGGENGKNMGELYMEEKRGDTTQGEGRGINGTKDF